MVLQLPKDFTANCSRESMQNSSHCQRKSALKDYENFICILAPSSMPILSQCFSGTYRDLQGVQLVAGSSSKAAQTQPSQLPRSESPHQSLQNGYLQFRASCGWTLSPLANLILLLALLPSPVVGPLSHGEPPLRVGSHLGVVVLRQLSCRTSSARKWDWGQHDRGITMGHAWDVSSWAVQRDQQLHHPIRVLLSFLRKNALTKQSWRSRFPETHPSKGL